MNIKHGDTVTLDNGDIVKISLEVLNKKVTELEVNQKYKLKYTDSFCFISNSDYKDRETILQENIWTYVGKINVPSGERYIFYGAQIKYAMFSTNNLDFVVSKIKY